MRANRREILAFAAGGAALLAAPAAWAAEDDLVAKAIKAFAGDKEPGKGKLTLTAPEIAENGNTVPVAVSVESPMTDKDHVAAVLLLADGNPNPAVAAFHFSPLSGKAEASTRIRLAKTQNVIALAKMSDGSVVMDKKQVKVTIGGCGG